MAQIRVFTERAWFALDIFSFNFFINTKPPSQPPGQISPVPIVEWFILYGFVV